MSIIARDEKGTNIPTLQAGVYIATCSQLIDLGVQFNEKFGKKQQKVQIVWQIAGETVEIGDDVYPRTLSKEYSLSLNEKSNLTKDLEAWRGQKFSEEELQGFDLINILGKSCQMSVIEVEKNGKKYNEISAIMSLSKGMEAPKVLNTQIFDFTDKVTWCNYKDIAKWIQDKIKKAENYESSGLKAYVEDNMLDKSVQQANDFVTISPEEAEGLPF